MQNRALAGIVAATPDPFSRKEGRKCFSTGPPVCCASVPRCYHLVKTGIHPFNENRKQGKIRHHHPLSCEWALQSANPAEFYRCTNISFILFKVTTASVRATIFSAQGGSFGHFIFFTKRMNLLSMAQAIWWPCQTEWCEFLRQQVGICWDRRTQDPL